MKEIRTIQRSDLDAKRGSQALDRFRDLIKDAKAKGRTPTSLTISRRCADWLKAHYDSIANTDHRLPTMIHGVLVIIDLGADKDFELRSEPSREEKAMSPIYLGRN